MASRYHHGDLPRALREAVVRQVQEGSIASVSIAAAARAVGVSSGAPYQHYKDRDDLLADVARETMDEMTARFVEISAALAEPRERLAALVVEFVAYSIRQPSRFRVLHAFTPLVVADERRVASADANAEPFVEAAREAFGLDLEPVVTASMFAIAVGFSELGVTDGIAQRIGVDRAALLRNAGAVAAAALEAYGAGETG
jgi:AcrR family transcriptional regulator